MKTPFKLLVAITAVLAAPALRADLMETTNSIGFLLTLTENTSTSLSVTSYTGTGGTSSFSVTPNVTDNWTVNSTNFPSIYFIDFIADFQEPLPEVGEVNEAYSGDQILVHPSFTVESDESLLTYQGNFTTLYPNGGITATPIGYDGTTPIFLQFFDNATASETASGVPDATSSLSLLAMSVAGLAALSRFHRFRLA